MEKSSIINNKNQLESVDLKHFFDHLASGFALQEIILNKYGEPGKGSMFTVFP